MNAATGLVLAALSLGNPINDTVESNLVAFSDSTLAQSVLQHPVDRNYPDFAEVPDVARFVEVNASLIFLCVVSLAIVSVLWVLYRRWG